MNSTTKKQFWRAFLFGMILVHGLTLAGAIQEVVAVNSRIMAFDYLPATITEIIELLIIVALTVFVFTLLNPILQRLGVRPFRNMNTKNIPLWKAGAVYLGCLGGMLSILAITLLSGLLLSTISFSSIEYNSLTMRLFLCGLSLLTLFAILQIKQQYQYWRR